MNATRTIQQQPTHLNDEQFADYAMGLEPAAEVTAHLAGCEACREELAGFGTSVGSFNQATMAWSESRPVRSLRAASAEPRFWRRPLLVPASWAVAACMLLALGVSVAVRHEQGVRPTELAANVSNVSSVASVIPAEQDSEAQIAQDNKLLMAVDVAIRSDERSPIEEYALQRIANGSGRARGGLKN